MSEWAMKPETTTAAIVEMINVALKDKTSASKRPRCTMMPVPAGTKSKDKFFKSVSATVPRSSGTDPLMMRPTNKITIPATGPGMGRPKKATIASPMSWQEKIMVIHKSMRDSLSKTCAHA